MRFVFFPEAAMLNFYPTWMNTAEFKGKLRHALKPNESLDSNACSESARSGFYIQACVYYMKGCEIQELHKLI